MVLRIFSGVVKGKGATLATLLECVLKSAGCVCRTSIPAAILSKCITTWLTHGQEVVLEAGIVCEWNLERRRSQPCRIDATSFNCVLYRVRGQAGSECGHREVDER